MQITKIALRKYKKYWEEETLCSEVKKEKLRQDALKTAEVDLEPIEDTSDLLRKRISQGKILYEKKGENSLKNILHSDMS